MATAHTRILFLITLSALYACGGGAGKNTDSTNSSTTISPKATANSSLSSNANFSSLLPNSSTAIAVSSRKDTSSFMSNASLGVSASSMLGNSSSFWVSSVISSSSLQSASSISSVASSGVVTRCIAKTYFRDEAWPKAMVNCTTCHVAGGIAAGTRFILKPALADDAVNYNYEIIKKYAPELVAGGLRLLEAKPAGVVAHAGGSLYLANSMGGQAITQLLNYLESPTATDGCNNSTTSSVGNLLLMDNSALLRKASIQLAGRIPTAAETSQVNSDAELDARLDSLMEEDAFYTRVKEIANDLLATDGYRPQTSAAQLLNSMPDQAQAGSWPRLLTYNCNGGGYVPTETCLLGVESLAAEPVEMIAHIVKSNHSFGEILTAQYRYLNVNSARLFGLESAFSGHESDPNYYTEIQIPSMHAPDGRAADLAGVVTTNAYLYRYPYSETGRNRKRAYYYLRQFTGKDVLKNIQRLDLSNVMLGAHPWKDNDKCNGCHALIDPVAGAFKHYYHCYGGNQYVAYFTASFCAANSAWFSAVDMFQPGATAAQPFNSSELQTPLKALGEYVVARPEFSRTITSHVFSRLTNRALLDIPTDPTSQSYADEYAAYTRQQDEIAGIAAVFFGTNLNFKSLIKAVVKSSSFRAQSTAPSITPLNYAELKGVGGKTWLPPEVLHRKIKSVTGVSWAGTSNSIVSPAEYLLADDQFKLFGGSVDSINILQRKFLPTAMTLTVTDRMAFDISCRVTATDFAKPQSARILFPFVDTAMLATSTNEAAIRKNLQYLHQRFLGENLAENSTEISVTLDLFKQLQARPFTSSLPVQCRSGSITADANGILRAWQGVLIYLLTDANFILEH